MFILLSPCSSLSQFLCVLFFWWFSFSPFLHVRQRAMISSTSGWPSCVRIVYLGKTRQWVSNVASFMLCPWARAPCQPWPLSPRKTELRSVEIPAQVNVTHFIIKLGKKKKNATHLNEIVLTTTATPPLSWIVSFYWVSMVQRSHKALWDVVDCVVTSAFVFTTSMLYAYSYLFYTKFVY